jgi:alpha-L-fucosidase
MKRHSRSIYGCTQAPEEFKPPRDCRYTYNPQSQRLYLHLFAWPFRHPHLPDMAGRVAYAQLLNDASEVKMLDRAPQDSCGAMKAKHKPKLLTLELPVQKPSVTVPVIELFLRN